MSNLITAAEFATFRDISKKIDTSKVDECIGLAQQSDLLALLGDFYFDVLANESDPAWADLMNGSSFTYEGKNYQHEGIKKILADYTYARFIYSINVNLTPFGAGSKHHEDTTPTDRNTLKDISKQAQIDAGYKWKYTEKYILSDQTLFSRYCEEPKGNTSFSNTKFFSF